MSDDISPWQQSQCKGYDALRRERDALLRVVDSLDAWQRHRGDGSNEKYRRTMEYLNQWRAEYGGDDETK